MASASNQVRKLVLHEVRRHAGQLFIQVVAPSGQVAVPGLLVLPVLQAQADAVQDDVAVAADTEEATSAVGPLPLLIASRSSLSAFMMYSTMQVSKL